ncbi:MAG TPA: hypothetical protein VE287_08835, partial [Actinopolymorphaceae bacterium]|nr:hypothetical protein [Actinopolymorphaceae bacterium]
LPERAIVMHPGPMNRGVEIAAEVADSARSTVTEQVANGVSVRMAALPDHALVMHPGPMNRGMEISADVADSARSVIVEQVTNGVAIRMAVLYLLLAGGVAGNDETVPAQRRRGRT